eukprot:11196910-Ditylum_brightwellii.AAC.1
MNTWLLLIYCALLPGNAAATYVHMTHTHVRVRIYSHDSLRCVHCALLDPEPYVRTWGIINTPLQQYRMCAPCRSAL